MRIDDLKGQKIGICVSGGLDSKSVTARLIEAGLDVVGFTADLAQPDETDIEDIPRRMAPTGAEIAGEATIVNRGMVGTEVLIEYVRLGSPVNTPLGSQTIFLGPGRSYDFSQSFPVLEGKQTFEVQLTAVGHTDEMVTRLAKKGYTVKFRPESQGKIRAEITPDSTVVASGVGTTPQEALTRAYSQV